MAMSGSDHANPDQERPEPDRIARFRQAPGTGPALLFFSGGTALRQLSRELVGYSHNSIHVITTFDSGGSSAELRRAFGMPAVGDLRNRLLALADRTPGGRPEVRRLAGFRFDREAERNALARQLRDICAGRDPLVTTIRNPERAAICADLERFRQHMPADFELRGASLGNLLITGAWLRCGRRIEPALRAVSEWLKARGTVLPVLDADLDLAAELEDGTRLHGQRELTGKESSPVASPVKRVWLTGDPDGLSPADTQIAPGLRSTIEGADLICFPMGSFYSSLVANLLPGGVGRAVAAASCPKVYVPNLGSDPESLGLGLGGSVRRLVRYLEADTANRAGPNRLLDFVLVDATNGTYADPAGLEALEDLGVRVLDRPLVSAGSAPLLDGQRLARALVSLC